MNDADLHLHTTASDGALTPSEVVRRAAEAGFETIAVTDHDTVSGIEEALEAGRAYGVRVIPGIELSLRHDGEEIHLLGYGIDVTSPHLLDHLRRFRHDREQRLAAMIERLQALGYAVTVEDVLEQADGGSPGRPHVARALVTKGYLASVPEAFEQLLAEGRPAYVPRRKVGLAEGVALVHAAGGAAVCAHPGLYRKGSSAVEALVAVGVDGIEVIHSAHSEEETRRWEAFTREKGLIRTGGSDCHGPGVKREVYLGRFRIPAAWVAELDERIRLRQGLAKG